MKRLTVILAVVLVGTFSTLYAQQVTELKSIAVVSIDTKGLTLGNLSMGNLVRIELEKMKMFEVLDKYDASLVMEKNDISPEDCFGKNQLVDVGKIIGADYMLSGSAETFGDKFIMILRLINVNENKIEKSSVMEYVNQEEDIQMMVRLSVNDLLGIPNDPELLNLLVNIDRPITSDKTTLTLNGPRFGMSFYTGEIAKRMQAPTEQGGYNSVAYSSIFGYQHELQYVSKGSFQALFEFIGAINGIETNHATFSLTVLNGLRYQGWEFGFGPTFRFAKLAEGYYDSNGNWVLASDMPEGMTFETFDNIDSRGSTRLSTGLIFAVGKTFKIGYLNLPINLYYSPSSTMDASTFGILAGFNVAKKQKQSIPKE